MEVERIFSEARLTSDEEIVRACELLKEKMMLAADTIEVTIYYLRQIYQLQFTTKSRQKLGDAWKTLIEILLAILDSSRDNSGPTEGRPKSGRVHKFREQTLALFLMKEISPLPEPLMDSIGNHIAGLVRESQSALVFEGSLSAGMTASVGEVTVHRIINNAKQKTSRSCTRTSLILLQLLLRQHLGEITTQDAGEISARIAQALTSTQNTVSPALSKVGGVVGRRTEPITELDGTPLRDVFTVLNLCRHYSSEQILSICCFSLVRVWLSITKDIGAAFTDVGEEFLKGQLQFARGSPIGRLIGNSQFYDNASSTDSDSLGSASLSSSMSSLHSYLYVDDSVSGGLDISQRDLSSDLTMFRPKSTTVMQSSPLEASKMNQVLRLALNLDSACLKYCKRVISQYDRVPKQQANAEAAKAACVEALEILNILCSENEGMVQQVFPEIQRLHSRVLSNLLTSREIFVAIMQFFISNHESTVYDMEGSLSLYFQEVPSKLFHDPFASFELLTFCIKNKEYFQANPKVLRKCYPNLLKVIAWHPRTFVKEFIEIIPLLISKENACEVFNSLLDLPSLSLMLEFIHEKKLLDNGDTNMNWSLPDAENFSLDKQRTIFKFFVRRQSTSEDLLDSLEPFYSSISSYMSRARVAISCQIVPILLEVYFGAMKQQTMNLNDNHFPLLCQRLFKLFPVNQFQEDTRTILAQQAKEMCTIKPEYISNHQESIISVIHKARRGGPAALHVLSAFIGIVGRFASSAKVCTPDTTLRYYETLETMVYEVSNIFAGPLDMPCSGKSISILMSATAKLSACSQDFVPRTVLCLSKLTSNPFHSQLSPLSEEEHLAVLERAQELVGILRMPNVAQSILCNHGRETAWHLDKNASVLLKVHAIARQTDFQTKK